MNLIQYQILAQRTMKPEYDKGQRMLNAAFGVVAESGEICDLWKKFYFHGHPRDDTKLAEEFGDLFWYLAQLSNSLDVWLGDFPIHPMTMQIPTPELLLLSIAMCTNHISAWIALRSIAGADVATSTDLIGIVAELLGMIEHFTTTIMFLPNWSPILEANIAKLKLRYPDAFTTEASLARVDVVEESDAIQEANHGG